MKRMKLQTLILGLLVVAAGVTLAAFNMELLPSAYRYIVFSWPSLLLAIGFTFLFGGYRHFFGGLALMVVGGFFLLGKLNVEWFHVAKAGIWPVVIVLLGLSIVLKSFLFRKWRSRCCFDHERAREWHERRRDFHSHAQQQLNRRGRDNANRSASDYVERSSVFGSIRERVESQNFGGGDISCVFGSLQLDLTSAQLAEGESYLEINTVFGGVELYIPADWKLELRQTNMFGSFVDNRPKPTFEVNDNRKLVLQIASVFGGGEIKSHEPAAKKL